MPPATSLPIGLRLEALRRELAGARASRRPRAALRSVLSFVMPGRWPPGTAVRGEVLDAAMAAGDLAAARVVFADAGDQPEPVRPGRPGATRRAVAIGLLAPELDPARRRVEEVVAAYLRGELSPPPAGPQPADAADSDASEAAAADAVATASALADGLRARGHRSPVIVATFPGFSPNPYGRLMETANEAFGFAAIHLDRPGEIDAVVAGAAPNGYRVVVHCNAPDRFVPRAHEAAALSAATEAAIARIDAWIAASAILVTSVHNGARLSGDAGTAERRVAQAIADRARLIHVLTASTPRRLAEWIHLDPARVVHVPHPSYAGAYELPPARDEARRRIGVTSDVEIVVGMLGSLTDRKGAPALVEALADVPDPLPDGRRLRLLIGGVLLGPSSEALIRAALADPRVIPRFGSIPDGEIPGLLAAMDVAVVPYSLLNSGWLHLALTFAIPVIAPADGTAAEIVRPAALRLFAADGSTLAETLASAGELATREARAAAAASVAELGADGLSWRFAEAVRSALAAATAAGDSSSAVDP
jgi:beta-1,4-mannosyltransferase